MTVIGHITLINATFSLLSYSLKSVYVKPLGNGVEIDFMIDVGHLGPNEHVSQGAKKKFLRNPFLIGIKVHEFYEINNFTKTLINKLL